ncbi:hypothetical protein BS47DRAFT_1352595 [Hydnum rufescens UP504]|uniref:Uncharacterized protein n=1 Tax=Hydnum rufescens UP504 TaxID=1448309 RepID=A0A9P6DQF2_9AGAM|nr:hypothetical protein BS47DRAFT_1352595 [Hydnum rufescens UP504]
MSNHRASLLSGLRTGGVRSSSNPSQIQMDAPYTTAIGTQFPRRSSTTLSQNSAFRDDAEFLPDFMNPLVPVQHPMTASVLEGGFPDVQQQHAQAMFMRAQAHAVQRAVMGSQRNMSVGAGSDQQALQMQLGFLRVQSLQQQQQHFQAQLLAQAQLQQQIQAQQASLQRRRPSETIPPLADPRASNSLSHQQALSGFEVASPMTAALDGQFPNVRPASGLNPNAVAFKATGSTEFVQHGTSSLTSNNWRNGVATPSNTPATPGFTTVISGGASLGTQVSSGLPKHDTATSWRRPSVASSLPRGDPSPPTSHKALSPSSSPPKVLVSTPEETGPVPRNISPPSTLSNKPRPQPLHFPVPAVLPEREVEAVQSQDIPVRNGGDSNSSSPTPTAVSSGPSSAREEATRRLYEGLGIGRPGPQNLQVEAPRQVSIQPARQPRGPPSGVEDLGARNFAARIRRKAIGGLGVLMDARGRRESIIEVEAY